MKQNSNVALAILVVGLANALVFAWGLNLFNTAFKYKDFGTSISTGDGKHIVALSNNRFAVVENSRVTVFQVSGNGKVSRLDDVNTEYRNLQPYMSESDRGFDNPRPR